MTTISSDSVVSHNPREADGTQNWHQSSQPCSAAFGLANTRILTRGIVGPEVIICCWHSEAHTSDLLSDLRLFTCRMRSVRYACLPFISKEWLQEQGNSLCNINSASIEHNLYYKLTLNCFKFLICSLLRKSQPPYSLKFLTDHRLRIGHFHNSQL